MTGIFIREQSPKMVPDSHLAQKDIQVHKRGKKPERNLSRSSWHVHMMSNIIDLAYFCQSQSQIS